jgi:multidrug transporter EmrE-like cation transporter
MTLSTFGLAIASILASTFAQAMLKYGMDRGGGISPPGSQFVSSMQQTLTDPFVLGGLFLLTLAAPMWLEVLFRLPLSQAYPLVSVGYVISIGIGVIIFKEDLTVIRVGGVGLIILGVVALSRS